MDTTRSIQAAVAMADLWIVAAGRALRIAVPALAAAAVGAWMISKGVRSWKGSGRM